MTYITNLTLANFRNIPAASIGFGPGLNVLAGANQIGKTNTLLAIYWALTDYMLDGSADAQSLKPKGDTAAEVSVELTFSDGFSLRKTYAENWVKTRGSDETTMQGHVTTYYINGTKTAVNTAKKEILTRFGLSPHLDLAPKFDLLRAVIDPTYLGLVPWQNLRAFIIALCGDVSPEEIFDSNKNLEEIRTDLRQHDGDTAALAKFIAQKIKETKTGITREEGKAEGLLMAKAPSPADLKAAKDKIEAVESEIRTMEERGVDANLAARVEAAKALLDKAEADYKAAAAADREANAKALETFNAELAKIQDGINAAAKATAEAYKLLAPYDQEINAAEQAIRDAGNEQASHKWKADELSRKIGQLYAEWDAVEAAPAPEAIRCPNCGHVLNGDQLKAEADRVAKRKADIITEGNQAKADLSAEKAAYENAGLKIEQAKQRKTAAQEARAKASGAWQAATKTEEAERTAYNLKLKQRPAAVISEVTKDADAARNEANRKYSGLVFQQSSGSRSLTEEIAAKRAELIHPQEVLKLQAAYEVSQANLETVRAGIKKLQDALIVWERKQILLETYIKARLSLFAAHISAVFPRMGFELIKPAIKEGSWAEVCTPMIVGKQTPYGNGSGSERILTGIYFIECVRRQLGIVGLPILFDEIDKLDSDRRQLMSMEADAQIISTEVADDLPAITVVRS